MTDRELIAVLSTNELPADKLVARTIGDLNILLCRLGNAVYAVENRCSHSASTLDGGSLRNGEVVCPLHGARFSLKDGRATCAPAKRPIACYEVVEQNDVIHIVKPPPKPPQQKFGPLG